MLSVPQFVSIAFNGPTPTGESHPAKAASVSRFKLRRNLLLKECVIAMESLQLSRKSANIRDVCYLDVAATRASSTWPGRLRINKSVRAYSF
jgi:hypothetical protein